MRKGPADAAYAAFGAKVREFVESQRAKVPGPWEDRDTRRIVERVCAVAQEKHGVHINPHVLLFYARDMK